MTIIKKWTHMGFKCVVKKHDVLGHFCGYVTVPKNHPSYGKHYDAIEGVYVHGGLTFYDKKGTFGFDCAHAGDYVEGMPKDYNQKAHKWTLDEVVQETEKLAFQFAKIQDCRLNNGGML